ncbi:MAG: D-aminoacyl-tRNA deacylase [Candidatus Dormiibacterota bacterium]
MRAVVQRVARASVSWHEDGGREHCERIGQGLLILLGIGPEDERTAGARLAEKVAALRIFEDERGRFDRSLVDEGGEALVVSQFTLFADVRRGRRPSFAGAGPPSMAEPLCEAFISELRGLGVTTRSGRFGAQMAVELVNDGPVTIVLGTDHWETGIG